MAVLVTMRPEYFGPFSERTAARYAHENIASFRWDEPAAMECAHEQLHELLPQGLDTPGHYLCEILDHAEGKTIGALWFGVTQSPGAHFAHLYDLHVDKGHARERHVRATLRLLEARCRELGASSIGLQIFAHDAMAQALYTSLGFSVTSFNMSKRIDGA
jgi:ribosomal protein S18 acetylase RimI-like enzyme